MATFKDLKNDWTALCQNSTDCWTESALKSPLYGCLSKVAEETHSTVTPERFFAITGLSLSRSISSSMLYRNRELTMESPNLFGENPLSVCNHTSFCSL
ncbi:hypothetical protein HZH66_012342 [Vespula vulgaris]|uniref:Uncharacterized protein n=2 Tax=Vespula TaxID=7451 RepID=A0A834NGF3_VESPE|nr:hypothetical protein HZH66_012342 [Vespula vulgaris]KAF7407044.1 hypothetical protein H0235_014700 [Vespula pensylvanica]